MMRHPNEAREQAQEAAAFLGKKLEIDRAPETAIVLGTGWGNLVTSEHEVPFLQIPGFASIERLAGPADHPKRVAHATVGGKSVVALRGRLHMNEVWHDEHAFWTLRLQIEMLRELGIRKLVLTCAAGGISQGTTRGSIVVINRFQSFAPRLPLFGGEFRQPQEALDTEFVKQACTLTYRSGHAARHPEAGKHFFWPGPYFETPDDIADMRSKGVNVVGMSVLPEAAVAAVVGMRTVAIAFVSNGPGDPVDDDAHKAAARANEQTLSTYLTQLVAAL